MTPPRLVLVRPRNADNLVAISRAMKAFGLSDWVTVSSPAHLDGMRDVLQHHRPKEDAGDGLPTLRRVDTLAEAIADCSWVVGTTMRTLPGRLRLTPRELAEETTRRRDTTWALVFGAECNGLMNEDVEQCHAVSFIPSSDEQPSLNLSQAVVVYGYELSTVASVQVGGDVLADDATLRQLRAALVSGLVGSRVMRTQTSNPEDVEALISSLLRGSLTAREAAQWSAAFRSRIS